MDEKLHPHKWWMWLFIRVLVPVNLYLGSQEAMSKASMVYLPVHQKAARSFSDNRRDYKRQFVIGCHVRHIAFSSKRSDLKGLCYNYSMNEWMAWPCSKFASMDRRFMPPSFVPYLLEPAQLNFQLFTKCNFAFLVSKLLWNKMYNSH